MHGRVRLGGLGGGEGGVQSLCVCVLLPRRKGRRRRKGIKRKDSEGRELQEVIEEGERGKRRCGMCKEEDKEEVRTGSKKEGRTKEKRWEERGVRKMEEEEKGNKR